MTQKERTETKIEFIRADDAATLPTRATVDSAGYDFYCVRPVIIRPGEVVRVDTGIKAAFPDDKVLLLFNRSSNPSKKKVVLMNGVGVVDSGYVNADTNIMFEFMNYGNTPVSIVPGEKIGQGVFVSFFTTHNDKAKGKRSGGFGSTG